MRLVLSRINFNGFNQVRSTLGLQAESVHAWHIINCNYNVIQTFHLVSYATFELASKRIPLSQVDEVLGQPPHHRKPSMDDSPRLPYIEATTLEVMRIETLVPLSIPRRTIRDTEVDGFFIPKNTMVNFTEFQDIL